MNISFPKITPSKIVPFVIGLGPWGWGVIAAGVLTVVIYGALVFVIEPRHRAVVKAQAHIATAEAQVQGTVAPKVVALTQKHDNTVAKVQQTQAKNAQAIDRLPSASTAIPDSDADAFVRGLCMYDSTSSDSACFRLPKAGS